MRPDPLSLKQVIFICETFGFCCVFLIIEGENLSHQVLALSIFLSLSLFLVLTHACKYTITHIRKTRAHAHARKQTRASEKEQPQALTLQESHKDSHRVAAPVQDPTFKVYSPSSAKIRSAPQRHHQTIHTSTSLVSLSLSLCKHSSDVSEMCLRRSETHVILTKERAPDHTDLDKTGLSLFLS